MSTRTIIEMYDDVDGTTSEEVKTFAFTSLEGVQYEIDLNPKNAAKFDKALAPYVKVARVVRRTRGKKKAAPLGRGQGHFRPRDHGASPAEIREWAKANGLDVQEKGAIPVWLGKAWLADLSSTTARSVREARPGAKQSAS